MSEKFRHENPRRESGDQLLSADVLGGLQSEGVQPQAMEHKFAQDVAAIRSVLECYDSFDAACAISVSELWPANVASNAKHLLALCVLIDAGHTKVGNRRIRTYEEFRDFATALIAVLPSFAIEDYVPEADWGEVRAPLGGKAVPIFYGGPLERPSDFVEAFRISEANNAAALADIDLAIAIQAHVQSCMPDLSSHYTFDIEPGHIEVPPQEFFEACRAALTNAGNALAPWRAKASGKLDVSVNAYQSPLGWDAFSEACLSGRALPFFGFVVTGQWLPIAVRSAISNVIESWDASIRRPRSIDNRVHTRFADFVHDRYPCVVPGPSKFWVGDRNYEVPVSCVSMPGSDVWLFILCTPSGSAAAEREVREVLSAIGSGNAWGLIQPDGRRFGLIDTNEKFPSAGKLRVTLVLTHTGTSCSVAAPKAPIRMLALADMVTIFDTAGSLAEVELFWDYIDEQAGGCGPMIGNAELFALFHSSNDERVEGAQELTPMALDSRPASAWRYRVLREFWKTAQQSGGIAGQ